jgi:hypothetical protein
MNDAAELLMDRISIVKRRLLKEEGKRPRPYNDKTGKTVTLRPDANISIGVGTNLENGLYDNEIDFIFDNRVRLADKELTPYGFMHGIDEVRASVILDLCFNDGLTHLLNFVHMLSAVANHNWGDAQKQLLDSDAARKDPNRYIPLGKILLTGEP